MENIPVTNGYCPHCGKKISGYNQSSKDFGTPVRYCKHCQKPYLDTRYIELAVEGYNPNYLTTKMGIRILVIGIIGTVLAGGINLLNYYNGYYSLRAVLCSVLGLILIIIGIVDIIRVKTGLKAKSLEKKRTESVQRLKNKTYALTLKNCGYNVPQEYLE